MVSLKVLEENIVLPTSGVKCEIPKTMAFIADQDYGLGTLCVAESNLIWKKENSEGLCIEYPNIALHAISRDLTAFPHECIYVLLDKNILKASIEDNQSDSGEEDESENITVIRFVPEDKSVLDKVFLAMNDCQALYPDSMSGEEDEENENDLDNEYDQAACENDFVDDEDENELKNENQFYDIESNFNPDEVELSERGQQILRRLNINYQLQTPKENNEINIELNNEQYEDAEGNQS